MRERKQSILGQWEKDEQRDQWEVRESERRKKRKIGEDIGEKNNVISTL